MQATVEMTKSEIETLEALPHQLGCFEWIAEEIVEEAAEQGIALTGDHDEIYRGMMIIARFHRDLIEGTRECRCQTRIED